MSENKVKKVALVGIDGAGKSTIMRRFLELSRIPKDEVMALTCPQFHDTPNVPLAQLSEALDVFSKTSDEMASFELKASALFLQMTLYGPIEGFMLDNFKPKMLISERHPIVDTLAYGPFYSVMVKEVPDADNCQQPLSEKINQVYGNAFDDILHWQDMQNGRQDQSLSIWDLPVYVRDLFASASPAEILAELSKQYRSDLPDVVLLLDPGLEAALERIQARSAGEAKELHEQSESLEHLRQSYLQVMEALKQAVPGIQVHVINTGSGEGVDETLQQVIDYLEI